jgi:hypothetical protein
MGQGGAALGRVEPRRHSGRTVADGPVRHGLRADAARSAANPEYQAEARAIREEPDELRAW